MKKTRVFDLWTGGRCFSISIELRKLNASADEKAKRSTTIWRGRLIAGKKDMWQAKIKCSCYYVIMLCT